jgi:hypothetical protein
MNGNQLIFPATYSSLDSGIKNVLEVWKSADFLWNLQQFRTKNTRNGNNFFVGNVAFLKFKYENVHKVKNKPDPTLLRTSYLSIEIKKSIAKSHETIPLKRQSHEIFNLWFFF